jgi:nicotinate-nucleotide--dimethylbenzimidazole phosphoribosyltransferase
MTTQGSESHSLILDEVDFAARERAAVALADIMDLDPDMAEQIVEAAPITILDGLSANQAKNLVAAFAPLSQTGGDVRVRQGLDDALPQLSWPEPPRIADRDLAEYEKASEPPAAPEPAPAAPAAPAEPAAPVEEAPLGAAQAPAASGDGRTLVCPCCGAHIVLQVVQTIAPDQAGASTSALPAGESAPAVPPAGEMIEKAPPAPTQDVIDEETGSDEEDESEFFSDAGTLPAGTEVVAAGTEAEFFQMEDEAEAEEEAAPRLVATPEPELETDPGLDEEPLEEEPDLEATLGAEPSAPGAEPEEALAVATGIEDIDEAEAIAADEEEPEQAEGPAEEFVVPEADEPAEEEATPPDPGEGGPILELEEEEEPAAIEAASPESDEFDLAELPEDEILELDEEESPAAPLEDAGEPLQEEEGEEETGEELLSIPEEVPEQDVASAPTAAAPDEGEGEVLDLEELDDIEVVDAEEEEEAPEILDIDEDLEIVEEPEEEDRGA